ncbi:MAG: carbohydrate kinase family protein, partial [Candidatus Brocadiia bacterium]
MDSSSLDVVAAGHICVDITPDIDSVSAGEIGEILRPGKLLEVGSPTISSGGPVSNTGLTLRRLGLDVALMGKCGVDPFGDMLMEVISAEAPGAEQGMSVTPEAETSYSVVLAIPGFDRIFLHCAGCNHTFGPEDINGEVVSQARLFHFGYPPLMRRMYESNGEELEMILCDAADAGPATSLDMALPDPEGPAADADWREILSRVLPHTDIFLPSLEELMFMLRRKRFEELTSRPGGVVDNFSARDIRSLATECLEMGCQVMVIKCGHLGAYLKTEARPEGLGQCLERPGVWGELEIFDPTYRVQTIESTTGSGDSSISGFLAAMLRGRDPEICMACLNAVGAQNLSRRDAVSGVRSWSETIEWVRERPDK